MDPAGQSDSSGIFAFSFGIVKSNNTSYFNKSKDIKLKYYSGKSESNQYWNYLSKSLLGLISK